MSDDEDSHELRPYFPDTIYCTECSGDGNRVKCILEPDIIDVIDTRCQMSESTETLMDNYIHARFIIEFATKQLKVTTVDDLPPCIKNQVCSTFLFKDDYNDYTFLRPILGLAICPTCNQSPCEYAGCFSGCVWDEYSNHEASYTSNSEVNKKCRYALYRAVSQEIHGTLGKGVRKKLPDCITTFIMMLCPDPNGQYKGFDGKGETK